MEGPGQNLRVAIGAVDVAGGLRIVGDAIAAAHHQGFPAAKADANDLKKSETAWEIEWELTHPENRPFFPPGSMLRESVKQWEKGDVAERIPDAEAAMGASFLMQNNIKVSFFAFAFGILGLVKVPERELGDPPPDVPPKRRAIAPPPSAAMSKAS